MRLWSITSTFLFWFLFGVCAYWFIFFKLQGSVIVLLPSASDLAPYVAVMVIALIGKVCVLLWFAILSCIYHGGTWSVLLLCLLMSFFISFISVYVDYFETIFGIYKKHCSFSSCCLLMHLSKFELFYYIAVTKPIIHSFLFSLDYYCSGDSVHTNTYGHILYGLGENTRKTTRC